MGKVFLTAEWRKLVMVNYAVEKEQLIKYLPAKTDLDLWNETCYLSLVGFMFMNTRVKGVKIPFHINFEEINLRFYVRHHDGTEWKRGVVFIKEIVPKPALTFVANTVYKEHYETMAMNHSWTEGPDQLSVEYRCKKNHWNSFRIVTEKNAHLVRSGSEEEFISEHYWGYTKINETSTSEYGVEHPKWQVYPTIEYTIDFDFGAIYGPEFDHLRNQKPKSVFLAEGSEISVKDGRLLSVN